MFLPGRIEPEKVCYSCSNLINIFFEYAISPDYS